MPLDSQFLSETVDLGQRARWLTAVVVRLGWWRATLMVTAASALASLLLTWAWLRLQGFDSMGDAFYLALGVPVPITLLGAGLTLRLVLALEQSRREVQRLAVTDALTSLGNRRYFMHSAQQQVELARRHGQPLSLLLFDVDHFKRVNDLHGHLEGDRLLTAIGATCQALMRTSDLLARFGGEEFIVLLPNTRQDQAVHLAERMRTAVAGLAGQRSVTISIGVVSLNARLTSLDSLIKAADDALYAAKRNGRDRVQTAPMLLEPLGSAGQG